MNREEQLAVGEWVRGKTKDGELIHGFVESIDSAGSTVHVYVVNCDNDMTVGKVVATRASWIEVMAESAGYEEGQLYDLMDLALATKDREWFMELASASNGLQKGTHSKEKRMAEHRHVRNRLAHLLFRNNG